MLVLASLLSKLIMNLISCYYYSFSAYDFVFQDRKIRRAVWRTWKCI